MFRFLLPDIGEGVVEAEVIEWRVREGERVAQDQVLVELMTDKANIEIPSPVAGVVHKLGFAKGDIVPVGAVLIEIDDGADARPEVEPRAASAPAAQSSQPAPSAPPSAPPRPQPAARSAPEVERPVTTTAPAPPEAPPRPAPRAAAPPRESEPGAAHPPTMPPRPGLSHHRGAHGAREEAVHAVPAVRELAKRLGVELERVRGTGPSGRVMRRDVEAAAAAPPEPRAAAQPAVAPATAEVGKREAPARPAAPDPSDWRRVPLRGLRRAIARHMREARQHAAHFTYVEELDLTDLLAKSDALGGQKLSPLAFIARAVVRALPEHPSLNASLDEARDEVVYKEKIHLGIAVAAPDGLVVPVIRDAAALTTRDLALATDALARRAREGKLTPDELRGGTFTISSLGKLGGIVSTPIVNYPEVAILGVNAIRKLPRFLGDQVVARRLMNLSISVDHRVADGAHAAQFVADVKALLESADFPDVFGK
jgi:pyruvate/2-oxoglutarate dehydrogenase complex dihydrolipoamide acyltransferase (E2) component